MDQRIRRAGLELQLHMASPTRRLYLHTLQKLGTRPDETLFIDDKRVNVDAAIALGMKAVEFSTIDRLRTDLIAAGLGARASTSLKSNFLRSSQPGQWPPRLTILSKSKVVRLIPLVLHFNAVRGKRQLNV